MPLAKKVKLKGNTTQKNFVAKIDINTNAIKEIKKYSQYFPVDLVVSILILNLSKIKGTG